MRTNYVLIDFENLQPELIEALNLEHFRVLVFMGANQPKVTVEFASMLQPLGTRASYLRITGSGRNALDVAACNRKCPGSQSSRFRAQINCEHRQRWAHIACE